MSKTRAIMAGAAAMLVSACGGGEPLSADAVKEKLRDELTKNDQTVVWVNVVAKEEPGKWRAFIDRRTGDDFDTEETLLCNVSATTNSSTRTCQTADPSIMRRAVKMLKENYASRNLEVRELILKRTNDGNKFGGHVVVINPTNGQPTSIPCQGDQPDDDFTVDCNQKFAEPGSAS